MSEAAHHLLQAEARDAEDLGGARLVALRLLRGRPCTSCASSASTRALRPSPASRAAAGPPRETSSESSATSMRSSARTSARRISFSSCRTLPGQGNAARRSSAARVTFTFAPAPCFSTKRATRSGMSSRALAERRDADADDVEPVEEVLAERAGRDHRLEVAMGRADDAHVDACASARRRRGAPRRSAGRAGASSASTSGISPISSRKSVPPSATSKRPARVAEAPVNAPRTWPKSVDSSSVSGTEPQFSLTNGARAARRRSGGWRARRAPCRCPTRRRGAPAPRSP